MKMKDLCPDRLRAIDLCDLKAQWSDCTHHPGRMTSLMSTRMDPVESGGGQHRAFRLHSSHGEPHIRTSLPNPDPPYMSLFLP